MKCDLFIAKSAFFMNLLWLMCIGTSCVITQWRSYPNDRPIIGVMAQECGPSHNNKTCIVASYVKFLEAGGARVVPIHIGRPNSSYDEVLKSINGLVFPNSNLSYTTSEYAKYLKQLFDFAKEQNDLGNYFPIWATAFGAHQLATFFVPNHPTPVVTNCSALNLSVILNLTADSTDGRLFSQLPTDVYQTLLNLPVAFNNHSDCITPSTVEGTDLSDYINILSINRDKDNNEFVSTYEAIKYPFYGLDWQPEMNPWEWSDNQISHSPEAIRATQYFASFFVNEARKSIRKFEDPSREEAELIYNINPRFTGKSTESDFEQVYYISKG